MPVDLIGEDELRAALRPHRPDAEAFEAKVRERLAAMEKEQEEDPLSGLPPFARRAAALLPLQLISGGKAPLVAAKLLPATGFYKLLGYIMLPALSLFLLLGASLWGVARIRRQSGQPSANLSDEKEIFDATRTWWGQHSVGATLVFLATIVMQWIGQTWLLFLMYIVSLGLLLHILSAFKKIGLGNRSLIGTSCMMGLMFLGNFGLLATTGHRDIHLVDQSVIAAIFLSGSLLLLCYLNVSGLVPAPMQKVPKLVRVGVPAVFLVPLVLWLLNPLLFPATPAAIKSYVESPDNAPYNSHTWKQWEIVAGWAIERGLDPDLSAARQSLAEEVRTKTRPDAMILGYALRLGLVGRDELKEPRWQEFYQESWRQLFILRDSQKKLAQLKVQMVENKERREREQKARQADRERRDAELAKRNPELAAEHARRRAEMEETIKAAQPLVVPQETRPIVPAELQPIVLIDSVVWVLEAAAIEDELSDEDRDFLASRLHATIEQMLAKGEGQLFEDLLTATRLLAVIGRPVDPEHYRDRVYDWLLKAHVTSGGGFQPIGGFTQFLHMPRPRPEPQTWSGQLKQWFFGRMGGPFCSLDATASAVGLMQVYGIPPGLELNWVRSFLKPTWTGSLSDDKWIAAVTLDRLNRLPGAEPLDWIDALYYERSLLAAMVLVGLCIYATMMSPKPKSAD